VRKPRQKKVAAEEGDSEAAAAGGSGTGKKKQRQRGAKAGASAGRGRGSAGGKGVRKPVGNGRGKDVWNSDSDEESDEGGARDEGSAAARSEDRSLFNKLDNFMRARNLKAWTLNPKP